MTEKTIPMLTAILAILIVIFVLAAYFVFQGRNRSQDLAAVEEAITASTTPALAATSTSATASAPTVPARVEQKTSVRPQSVSPGVQSAEMQPAAPIGRLCTANDLSGMASWERTGSYLTGSIRIKNSSNSDCVLSRSSNISIFSGYRLLADRDTSRPQTDLAVPRGEERLVRFTWSNWCGGKLSNPAFVLFTMPGSAGYLRIPLISPDGDPQYESPQCGPGASGSSIDMWW